MACYIAIPCVDNNFKVIAIFYGFYKHYGSMYYNNKGDFSDLFLGNMYNHL